MGRLKKKKSTRIPVPKNFTTGLTPFFQGAIGSALIQFILNISRTY